MASSAFSPEHHSADQPTATNRQFWERRTEECTGRVVVDALAVHLHCGGAGVQLVEGVHSLARRDDPLAVGELVQRQLRCDLVQLLAAHVGHERDRLQALHHLAPSLAPLLHGVRERLVLLLRRPPRGPLHRAASRRQRDRAQDLRARGESAEKSCFVGSVSSRREPARSSRADSGCPRRSSVSSYAPRPRQNAYLPRVR